MNNFIVRSITGTLYVGVIVAALLLGKYSFAGLIVIMTALSLVEFYNLIMKGPTQPQRYIGTLLGTAAVALVLSYSLGWTPAKYLWLILLLFLTPMVVEVFRGKASPLSNIASTLLAFLYIPLSLSLLVLLAFLSGDYDYSIVLGLFVFIWSNDTFAYLTGKLIGKTPLYPSISPMKTIEGFAGGAFVTIGITFLWSYFFTELPLHHWLIIGLIIIIFGSIGDLFESSIKRNMKVKDSGTLLKGHGGVLDRLDSLFFSVPIVYIYLALFL